MAGNRESGLKAADTNRKKHGDDFYKKISSMGGKVKNPNKGFGSMSPERRREVALKGRRKQIDVKYEEDSK